MEGSKPVRISRPALQIHCQVHQSSQGAASSSANLLGLSVPDQGPSSAPSDGAVVPDHSLAALQSAGPRVPDSRSQVTAIASG